MTPEELFRYDVSGFLLIPGAIESDYLTHLNARLDEWEEKARKQFEAEGNPQVRYDDILNQEPALLDLVVNPVVLPYLVEMVERPRLKSTWATFKWRGGETGYHSNHTPTVTHNLYHFNGQIRHNLFQVFYAMHDIGPGEGALKVVPGSHKANYVQPPVEAVEDMLVEIPMKAGDVLLFTHDLGHCSRNESDNIRRTIIFTYCPGVISNSFGGDGLYDALFEGAPDNSWLKYLLRRPNGYLETYPQPECGVAELQGS